jgi:hypothetical protein
MIIEAAAIQKTLGGGYVRYALLTVVTGQIAKLDNSAIALDAGCVQELPGSIN